jgi:DeoR family transcriptional regulator, deoxyribose operon repressor
MGQIDTRPNPASKPSRSNDVSEDTRPLLQRRQDRLDRLDGAIKARGVLRLREAAALVAVSEMTVRRDIAACEGRFTYLGGYIFGGQDAAARETSGVGPYVFAREAETNAQGKREACIRAAELIEPGDTIFIDCGTTLHELATRLPTTGSFTVVCYAMSIAEIVCKQANLTVMMLGGLYQASSASFYSSPESLEMLGRIGITKAFLSAGGVHVGRGVSCSNFHEVPIKQKALQVSLKSYVVIDSSKFGVVRPAFFAPLNAFDAVVTDGGLTASDRVMLDEAGVPVTIPGDRRV